MVNPMPVNTDTPYNFNQLLPSGNRASFNFIASQLKPKTPSCLPTNNPDMIPSDTEPAI